MKEKPVVMFCTGGILKYFEECGGLHYRGDCFVFDKHVAVWPDLAESELAQCFACQAILSAEAQQAAQYVVGKSCPHCCPTPEIRVRQRIAERHTAWTPTRPDRSIARRARSTKRPPSAPETVCANFPSLPALLLSPFFLRCAGLGNAG